MRGELKLKRLVKKAEHDVDNRDFAFVYIGGKYYENATHALCLRQYLKENEKEVAMDSYLLRPDIEQFEEISKEENKPVVLGHYVEKEDGIFIIYGCIDGDFVEFNRIPKNILHEISNYYGLPCYDDFEHDEKEIDNQYDEDENYEKSDKEQEEAIIEDLSKTFIDNGFTFNNNFFTNGYVNVGVKFNQLAAYSIGNEESLFFLDGLDKIFKLQPTKIYKKLVDYGAEIVNNYYDSTTVFLQNKSNTIKFKFTIDNKGKVRLISCDGDTSTIKKEIMNQTGIDILSNNIDIFDFVNALYNA